MATIIIHGRLTAKPEQKNDFATFTVAENHTNEKASYFNCKAKLSEKQLEFMNQGNEILVTGDLSINKVVKEDKTYTNVDVFVYNIKFVGSKKETGSPA